MTPFCQRRPDESIPAWHRRVHETAHDWRDVAELMTMRGLHAEAKMVTSVAHLKREERTVALLGVAEERGLEAETSLWDEARRRGTTPPVPCGQLCVLVNQGPCGCEAPANVAELRKRQRALLWAAEALMRPEFTSKPRTDEAPPSTERAAIQAEGRSIAERTSERAGGPTASTLADVARVCLLDAREEPHEGEKKHLKKLADQMIERAGGLARSAAEVRR